jgi:preprotein translocase subunit YajC
MFISPAYAQALGDGTMQMVQQIGPLVLILVVFYFLLIRPQQQKAKEHKTMLASLRRGDRVVTGGGIIGTIAKVVSDEEILVDIAETTRVRVLRSTITAVTAKTEPVAPKSDKDDGKDGDELETAEGGSDRRKGGRRAAGSNS